MHYTKSITIAVSTLALAACPKGGGVGGVALRSGAQATEQAAKDNFECKPANAESRYFCTKNKALLGQEATLLGTVYKVEKIGDRCPAAFSDEEHREPIVPGLDKQAMTLTNAVTTQVDFALVQRNVAVSVSALAFLSGSLQGDAVANVELVRTTRAIQENAKFNDALLAFAQKHPSACRLYVATAYAADYLTARVFTSATAEGGGGVYGVNVGGKYFASDESVKRDYQWALNIVRIDVGESPNKGVDGITLEREAKVDAASAPLVDFALPPALAPE